MKTIIKGIVKVLVNIFLCHVVYRVRYKNINIPRSLDKCLICPNHSHILDPFWVFARVNKLHIMGKSELFENKFYAYLLTSLGGFPIRRGQKDAKSLIHAIRLLKAGKRSRLLMFPEGGILKPELRRKTITDGATYIAAKTELPIIPAYITENPKLFSKVIVKFGEPIYVDKELIKDKEELSKKSKELLNTVYSMEEKKGRNNG